MKIFSFALIATAGIALSACDDITSGTGDTADTETGDQDVCQDDALLFTSIAVDDCTSTTWSYAADFDGWTSNVELFNTDQFDPAWQETHTLSSVNSGDCFDETARDLAITTDWSAQEDDVSTLRSCDADTKSGLLWILRSYDVDGNLAECIWTGDADGWPRVPNFDEAGLTQADCTEWTGTGAVD